ncbi:MAG TPA: biotin--[acetyl-CoA-carboxylase] ligase [Bacteroidales bacterium]|nr:biotin--[acetyl-CoA-carboxylase] ligase [Bacteroidales bacterium]HPT22683.1 biotin--[acetyl-CoA-carboxylase] ligase [Bacteroidales bacterium]
MIIGSNLLFFKNLTSTNTYSAILLKNSTLQEGTVVYTNFQSSGKGQQGNRWESEDGKNLLISIILFPAMISPADQFFISMLVSLGICDFLKRYLPVCAVKWPNDIYVKNDKIAGILIENSIMGDLIESSIAGIGLNINQKNFISNAPNPVSLRMITGKDFDVNTCLSQLLSDLDKRYKQLIGGKLSEIKMDYISQLFRLNEWHSYRDINGIYTGRIVSVTDIGRLQVEQKSGKINEYNFKEVEFIL